MPGRNRGRSVAVAVSSIVLVAAALQGCSSDRSKVEDAAVAFVKAIQERDTEVLEKIVDWDRFYSYGKEDEESPPVDVEKQRDLLMKVLARDVGLSMQYLTCDNFIDRVSINGGEAEVKILQVDRSSGKERIVTLLLEKVEGGKWMIYRFETKEVKKTG